MHFRGLAPFRRHAPANPFERMQQEMDRLMRDFEPFGERAPFWSGEETGLLASVDVSETDGEMQIVADLPGLDEEDIDLTLANGVLIIKGERKSESEEKDEDRNYHRIERSYGAFTRRIALPCEVESDKAEADFSKGVLTVRLPKSPAVKEELRKIQVKAA